MDIIEQTKNGVTFYSADGITAAGGVAHGFSTRLGGVSGGMWTSLNLGVGQGDDPDHVRENYHRFFAAIGGSEKRLAMSNQVHGAAVRTITTADLHTDPYNKVGYEADGLMTDLPGVALVVYCADCIPILFYDPVRRCAAAVHAGWRGTAAGIATAAVDRMKNVYGSRPEDILAAIGPGIGPDCFETHEDVPNAMTAALGTGVLRHIRIKENGKFAVDLKAINAMRLEHAGLSPEHIAVSALCTSCDPDRFWSHRKLGTNRGTMAAAIQLL